MASLILPYAYFGTSDSTISEEEKHAGMRVQREGWERACPHQQFAAMTLVVEGQGIVAVEATVDNEFTITLTPSDPKENEKMLQLQLTPSTAKFFTIQGATKTEIESTTPKGPQAALPIPGVQDLYWLSLDKKNGFIRYGKTFRSASCTYLKAKVQVMIGEKDGPFAWIKGLKNVEVGTVSKASSILPPSSLGQISIGSLPVVNDLPPIVAESVAVTLEDLAVATTTSIANLSPECQRLYANVTGPGVKLDDKNFPDFSQALEYSIRTPGKLCYEKLKSKSGEFGDPLMTYLRITLGSDEGDSPGVPYVMEIWPSKHKSPIHDHGRAYAVIKVLHGEISASYYTKLDKKSGIKLEPDYTFYKEQVTWISPDQYQVHQLHNDSDRVCVTIQCYQYDRQDHVHDEYFHYLEAKSGDKKDFTPDSDWDFIKFKKLVKEEWEDHLKQATWSN
ncbi:hypothetical protein HWV62_22333 [Athelia sp. TMB]|nr:hypothetical protein HWV62_27291 [Athelia sp. TMB]KAF7983356.1 hypothetical protein HWV62_22333 [Athelia sp. TMB]